MPRFKPGDKVWVAPDVIHGWMVPIPVTIVHAYDVGAWWACLHPDGEERRECEGYLFRTKEEATRRELKSLRGWIEGIESTPIPEGWQ